MSSTTIDVNEVAARYFEAWNADGSEREQAVAGAFAEDAYYCDGAAEALGRGAIAAMMDGVMTQFEGARFELASPVDSHHHQARFAWRMVGSDGGTVIDGIDAVRFEESGRILAALGFFGVDIPTGEPTSTAHTFRWERVYDGPADEVFALVSDLEVYAEVAPNLSAIEVLDGEGRGMVRRCTNPEGESWTETYTDWVPGRRYVTVVDVSTYPPSLAAMIDALEMSVSVEPVTPERSTVVVEIATELSDAGLQVLRDGGAADQLFQPILDGWGARLGPGRQR